MDKDLEETFNNLLQELDAYREEFGPPDDDDEDLYIYEEEEEDIG
jgi:hypothetical protein